MSAKRKVKVSKLEVVEVSWLTWFHIHMLNAGKVAEDSVVVGDKSANGAADGHYAWVSGDEAYDAATANEFVQVRPRTTDQELVEVVERVAPLCAFDEAHQS
jgi:hypothetical protein